jgi:NADH-quinone oxidoreductase subunit M
MSQNRLRRVLAFSSINHLAYCLLGAFALASSSKGTALFQGARAFAAQGIILQMFNHGITAAGLFWLAGILENRSGKFMATDFGCLGRTAPLFAFFFGVLGFSSLGLPGLNGFPGEFLIFKGTFSFSPWAASIATLALLFTALAYTRLFRVMLFGPVPEGGGLALQISRSERLGLGLVVALCLLLGVYPRLITDLSNATVLEWVKGMTL